MYTETEFESAFSDCMLRAMGWGMPAEEGAYGARLARCFRLHHVSWSVSKSFNSSRFAATRVVNELGMSGFCEAIRPVRGFIVNVHLNGTERWETWREGRMACSQKYEKGSFGIHDLRQGLKWRVDGPIDLLSLYLPLEALNEVADEIDGTHAKELMQTDGAYDPLLDTLGAAVLQVLENSGRLNQLFFDQLALAFSTQILRRYGRIKEKMPRKRGALSAEQERQAKDLLAGPVDSELSMAEIAEACGLSSSHVAASFRRSTGLTPHVWLTQYRVQHVKRLLRSSSLSIADVALTCGIADQSHLTRVFARLTGCTPAAWQREF